VDLPAALKADQKIAKLEEAIRPQRALSAEQRDAVRLVEIAADKGVASAAAAMELGDFFQYLIEQPVTLPRQKSAMLPIVTQEVDGTKVTIFNRSVHPKFPLLGLKFKNTTGLHLMQGPITVFESNSYAGDARIQDLQPKEERLISYAIDLGTEVETVFPDAGVELTKVKITKGIVEATRKVRETVIYNAKNRSEHDRLLVVEHPFRPQFKLITPEKPSERARDVYRFEIKLEAGKTAKHEVIEERDVLHQYAVTNLDDETIRIFMTSQVPSAKVKAALEKAGELKAKLSATQRDLALANQQLKEIGEDQARLRANLKEMPPTAAAYKRYLDKFDRQETEIEQLRDRIKQLQTTENQQRKDLDTYLAELTIE
jgi:hypothetical protein